MSNPVSDRDGFALIVVMVVAAMISFLALLILEYGRQGEKMSKVLVKGPALRQALQAAEARALPALAEELSDTPYLKRPLVRSWELPPNVEIKVKIRSLNDRINLNLLNRPGQGELRRTVTEIFTNLNYPRRVVDEIIRWIEPRGQLAPEGPDRYAGYNYSAPGRELRHLDELALISGFREQGITPGVREIFTVYGTGNLNLHHVTSEEWRLIGDILSQQQPALAESVEGKLGESLTDPGTRKKLTGALPFLSARDDSFSAEYTVEVPPVRRKYRAIYVRKNDSFELRTRYPVYD